MATVRNGQLYPDYDDHFSIVDHAGGMTYRNVAYADVMDVLRLQVYAGAPKEVLDYLDDDFTFPGHDDYLDLTVDWESDDDGE